MNDGSVQGHRYFECAPFSGRFLRHSAVEFHSRPPPARSNAAPTRSQPSQPSPPQPTPPKPVRSSRPAARRPSGSKTSKIPTSRVSTPRAAAGRVAGRTTSRRQVVSAGFRNRIEKGACGVKVRHCLLALSWCPVLRRSRPTSPMVRTLSAGAAKPGQHMLHECCAADVACVARMAWGAPATSWARDTGKTCIYARRRARGAHQTPASAEVWARAPRDQRWCRRVGRRSYHECACAVRAACRVVLTTWRGS